MLLSTGKLTTAFQQIWAAGSAGILPSAPLCSTPFSPTPLPSPFESPLFNNSHCSTLTLKVWEKGQRRASLWAIMSIWCYSRWERLWGSGQIRRREGSSRCWSRMMYCCSLWDSDNTSTKVEQGRGGELIPLIQTGLETRHTWKEAVEGEKHREKVRLLFFSAHAGFLCWSIGCGFLSFTRTHLITDLFNSLWRDEVGNAGNLISPTPPQQYIENRQPQLGTETCVQRFWPTFQRLMALRNLNWFIQILLQLF